MGVTRTMQRSLKFSSKNFLTLKEYSAVERHPAGKLLTLIFFSHTVPRTPSTSSDNGQPSP